MPFSIVEKYSPSGINFAVSSVKLAPVKPLPMMAISAIIYENTRFKRWK